MFWAWGQSSARSVAVSEFPKASMSQGALFYHFKEFYWSFGFGFFERVLFSEMDGFIKHHLEESVGEIRARSQVKARG